LNRSAQPIQPLTIPPNLRPHALFCPVFGFKDVSPGKLKALINIVMLIKDGA
jgi:hypothetical protein